MRPTALVRFDAYRSGMTPILGNAAPTGSTIAIENVLSDRPGHLGVQATVDADALTLTIDEPALR